MSFWKRIFSIKESPKVETPDAGQIGDIHEKARSGDFEAVQALLKHNPRLVSSTDDWGATPLYWAVLERRKDVIELLLANGAEANAKGQYGPLLSAAVTQGDLDTVTLLLANGANLYRAILHDARDMDVAALLLAKGANVNAKDTIHCATALWKWAGFDETTDVAALLLTKGADVNAKQDETGKMPLHRAAEWGRREMAKFLLANGANVNAKDNKGKTPLRWASFRSSDGLHDNVFLSGMVDLLRQHGGHE